MLLPRITPVLLLSGSDLVKTVSFTRRKYVGDPLNVVKIFNDLCVDELVIFDIDATTFKSEPNFELLSKLATVSRMPLCYGGGVRSIEHFERLITLGIEKVSLSSAALSSPQLISKASSIFGSQSVVVTLDLKRNSRFSSSYSIYTHNGKKRASSDVLDFCSSLSNLGVGELMINSIAFDGTLKGYDFNLLKTISPFVDIPITLLGGASSYHNISNLFRDFPFVSAGVASLFTFHGKYKAVLISYPDLSAKTSIFTSAGLL